MIFTYTYRDNSGALREGIVDAENRSEAMGKCRIHGIYPLSLKNNGVRSKNSSSSLRTNRDSVFNGKKNCYVLSVLLALLSVGGIWWFISHKKRNLIDETSEHLHPVSVSSSRKNSNTKPVLSKISANHVQQVKKVPSAVIIAPASETQQVESQVLEKEHKEGNIKIKPHPRTAAETFLVMITPREPGERMPPAPIPPDMDEEEVDKAMKNAVKASALDDERSIQGKVVLLEQKNEFSKLRKEGMTFSEYLKQLEKKFHDQADLMENAKRLNEELYNDRTISDEDYETNKQQINAVLREEGLPPLSNDDNKDE